MKFHCPECDQRIEAEDSWAGKSANCPKCSAPITVPTEVSEMASSKPPALIKFQCPKCDQRLEVEEAYAGQTAPCPHCSDIVTIPNPGATPPKTNNSQGKISREKGKNYSVYRRNFVREDGKVWFQHDSTYKTPGRWVTPEKRKELDDRKKRKSANPPTPEEYKALEREPKQLPKNLNERYERELAWNRKKARKFKRGDTREDGMVFWQYSPSTKTGESWVTQEKFKELSDKAAERQKKLYKQRAQKHANKIKHLKRGDIREDGMVFWRYEPKSKSGEYWVTPKKFAEKTGQTQKTYKKLKKKYEGREKTLSTGDTREEDDMVFYCYHPSHKNGECWVTPEKLEKLRAYKRDYNSTPGGRKRSRRYMRERRKSDPLFRLICNARGRINDAFRNHGYTKQSQTYELLGCTFEELKAHLESQFVEGMTWERKDEWHIDHILPLAAAKTEDELVALCHYSNLRPLWGAENLSKKDAYDEEELEDYFNDMS